MDIDRLIRKYALQNAIRYEGKANPKALVGKVLGEDPTLRKKAAEVQKKIKEIVEEVNSLDLDKQKGELSRLAPELLERRSTKREGLKPLPGGEDGKVVVRLAPSPSGPLHIGHAYVFSLNYEYAKMYSGRMYCRIEDTNPSNIYPDAYDLIPEDAKWLSDGDVVDFPVQSSRMNIYYDYAEKLFDKGIAYVCSCDAEEAREMLKKSIACPCRDTQDKLENWKDMFTKYGVGQAVVRFKSDIKHKNPAMRDFPLFRINEDEHPKVGRKYKVWPLMNFSVAIDDMEFGVTHALRGKDHADNAKRQEMIHHALGHDTPLAISVGRINFQGLEVSASKTKERLEKGEYSGWDDIRLPFLLALKRRGYQPAALRKFAVSIGVTKTDKSVSGDEFFKTINAFNKEILDSVSDRYFFVADPVKIKVEGAKEKQIELDMHPDNKKGGRTFSVSDEFFISKKDYDSIKDGQLVRLIDCLTFVKDKDRIKLFDYEYVSYKDAGKKRGPIIQWVVDDNEVKVDVRMPDNTIVSGLGEKWLNDVKEGDIVQLERVGFARCDSVSENKLEFWYAHK